eukprot:COSAG02_NODE_2430_length_8883_cov_3.641621_6_plen_93_part_00
MMAMVRLAVLVLGSATLSSAAPLPVRRLQKDTPLAVGSFCRRHCDDGSQPDVDRAGDCPAGTICAAPPHAVVRHTLPLAMHSNLPSDRALLL